MAPARAAYDRLFRDSTLIGAKHLGFEIARFNPGIGDLLPGGPGTVPEASWTVLDNHVRQCIHHGLDIPLTLARPPAGGDWNSVEYENGFWEWDQLDYDGVLDLYIAIIDRVVTDNSFPRSDSSSRSPTRRVAYARRCSGDWTSARKHWGYPAAILNRTFQLAHCAQGCLPRSEVSFSRICLR